MKSRYHHDTWEDAGSRSWSCTPPHQLPWLQEARLALLWQGYHELNLPALPHLPPASLADAPEPTLSRCRGSMCQAARLPVTRCKFQNLM